MKLPSLEKTVIKTDGGTVPVKVYREYRRNVRFSLGKRGAIIRMPVHLPADLQQKEWDRFRNWVAQKTVSKDGSAHAFGKTYQNGDVLTVGKRQYRILIDITDNKNHSGKIEGPGLIRLRLSGSSNQEQRKRACQHLLSRLVAQDFRPQIVARVMELNQLHFQKRVNGVNLKYNRSNWGSCSSKANINLSTCLLFAPDDVIDYVIIHELAHLVEMNHSPRFWALVKKAMPDYEEKKKWLKNNWQKCIF